MAVRFNGKKGVLNYNGSDLLNLYNWTVDVKSNTTEATPMVAEWVTRHRGFSSWTGTAETYIAGGGSDVGLKNTKVPGYIITSDITDITPRAVKFYMMSDASHGYFQGKAFIAGVNPKADATDNVTLSWSFQGTSDLFFKVS